MLDLVELQEIEEAVQIRLNQSLEEIIIHLNRVDRLYDFLQLIGLSELVEEAPNKERRNGKIIVVGESHASIGVLEAVAKKMGFSKDRFLFLLEYEDAIKFDFSITQWSDNYCAILVGPMPHSGQSKGEYGSVISALEHQDGYPPVIRMGSKELKTTKTSFKEGLEYLLQNGIAA